MSMTDAPSPYVQACQATDDATEMVLTVGSGPLWHAFCAGKWYGRAEERALIGDPEGVARAIVHARLHTARALAGAEPLERS